MAKVVSGSVSSNPDCRPCDLKKEFNQQIYASSAVIVIVGDKTSSRTAGSGCSRASSYRTNCFCTPYKQNTNGAKMCKIDYLSSNANYVSEFNSYSYIRHEFEQAKKLGKTIIVVYNSTRKEINWLPSYMSNYATVAHPFWTIDISGRRVGNYSYIKGVLGY